MKLQCMHTVHVISYPLSLIVDIGECPIFLTRHMPLKNSAIHYILLCKIFYLLIIFSCYTVKILKPSASFRLLFTILKSIRQHPYPCIDDQHGSIIPNRRPKFPNKKRAAHALAQAANLGWINRTRSSPTIKSSGDTRVS